MQSTIHFWRSWRICSAKETTNSQKVKIVKFSFTIPFCHNYLFGMQAKTLLILLCLVVLLCMNMHMKLPTEWAEMLLLSTGLQVNQGWFWYLLPVIVWKCTYKSLLILLIRITTLLLGLDRSMELRNGFWIVIFTERMKQIGCFI